ncbi:glycosyltransferase family 2 protein [Wenyingzhuangia sp. 1_MG-2023]|nr:glycosyltransferase family 2 protein [Wenyingzhuangia sp. 1_MG-2023]
MSVKVSIITIVYNNKECIKDAIESVRSQTYPNIEHLVIDGDSTDGTQEEIAPYVNDLGYYVSEKDTGLYNALNKGIQKATGDVIGILHSDDLLYEPSTIQKIVDCFQQSNPDLVYADGQYVSKEDTAKVKRIYKGKPYKYWTLYYGWVPLHTTMYIKKELFNQYGLYDETYRIASDYEYTIRLLKEQLVHKVYLNEWVVKMRLGGKSTTAKLQKKKSMEDLQIIRKHQLMGMFTLAVKIIRKIRQYLLPKFFKY